MRRMNTARRLNKGAAMLFGGLVFLSACVNAHTSEEYVHSARILAQSEAPPTPIPTVPCGENAVQEPSDPDAEPVTGAWTTSEFSPMNASILLENLKRPGYVAVLEKPPQG